MIARIALILGNDERALRLARKLAYLCRIMAPLELRRWLRLIEEVVEDKIGGARAA